MQSKKKKERYIHVIKGRKREKKPNYIGRYILHSRYLFPRETVCMLNVCVCTLNVYVYLSEATRINDRTRVFVHVVRVIPGTGARTMGPSRGYHSSGTISGNRREGGLLSFSAHWPTTRGPIPLKKDNRLLIYDLGSLASSSAFVLSSLFPFSPFLSHFVLPPFPSFSLFHSPLDGCLLLGYAVSSRYLDTRVSSKNLWLIYTILFH